MFRCGARRRFTPLSVVAFFIFPHKVLMDLIESSRSQWFEVATQFRAIFLSVDAGGAGGSAAAGGRGSPLSSPGGANGTVAVAGSGRDRCVLRAEAPSFLPLFLCVFLLLLLGWPRLICLSANRPPPPPSNCFHQRAHFSTFETFAAPPVLASFPHVSACSFSFVESSGDVLSLWLLRRVSAFVEQLKSLLPLVEDGGSLRSLLEEVRPYLSVCTVLYVCWSL